MLSSEVRALESENRALKKAIEKLDMKYRETDQRPMACEFCKFYLQHYIHTDGHFMKTGCGHCVHGRCKTRTPETKSCEYFEMGTYESRY